MEKTYSPQDIEQRWYQSWEQNGSFKPSGKGEPYCIILPPPNVTGTLHMGHGFQVSLMDALIRYHRMLGRNVLWQAGTDHAGIATQMVVERRLLNENIHRHDIGRERFVEKVWEWVHESEQTIKNQLRRMGASMDWSRDVFTLDENVEEAVLQVFTTLHEQGMIYRKKSLVNWDPVLRTALSDLEVVNKEMDGELWHIRYPLADGDGEVVVATTRPETMLGDTAVAVHPDDERYQHLIGKQVALPLTDRTIPIVADDYVDREFGSGCVKITPGHDFNDYDVGQRHDLEIINILTTDGHLNDNTPEPYRGLDRFAARKQVLLDLEAKQLLAKTEKHKRAVPHGDRSGAVLEPYLTDQWYVKSKPLAEVALAAVANGDTQFIPPNWKKTYDLWLEDIHDWCISRQLWWGHRIPAWYDEQGKAYVGRNETEIRKKHQLDANIKLTQDNDVLDTWFSSALWPFATQGWPEKTDAFNTFYPTSVLVTGFDIIFFWVARMMMMGLKFTDQVPFKHVYITGLIRDSEGQKMSKSKGNILDPIDLVDGIDLESLVEKRVTGLMQPKMATKIEKATRKEFPDGIPAFGTDALRFTYCALATTGRDVRFDMGRIEGYRNFCNKLWNAARYVLMNTEDQDTGIDNNDVELSLPDRWIRSRLQNLIKRAHQEFTNYRFDLLTQAIYDFTWNEYCDWYLELSKPILNNPKSTPAQLRGTRQTLVFVLENLLRILHPVAPFITEEIWQRVAPLAGCKGDTIMLQSYPEFNADAIDKTAEQDIAWLQKVIIGVRNIRGEINISPAKPLPLLLDKGNAEDKSRIAVNHDFLKNLARLESIDWVTDINGSRPDSATAFIDDLELLIPMAGLIDKDAEMARLEKEISKLDKDLQKSIVKLSNQNYVEKAPEVVVEKERNRVTEMQAAMGKLRDQLDKIALL